MKNFYKTQHSIIFQEDFCNWETGELLSPIETQNYTIVQVAELYYNNAFKINNHVQFCDLEITFPITNGLTCSTYDVLDKLQKHEFYLSFKGDRHSLFSRNGARFQTFAINFKNQNSIELLNKITAIFKEKNRLFMPNLSHFFTALIGEFLSVKQEFFIQRIDGLITEILVLIARMGKSVNANLTPDKNPEDFKNYIDEHFLDICSLDELSTKFGYTYGHICKTFKKAYDITLVEYFLKKKMEYSVLLLKENKPLTEIAEITGYSTPYNFSRAFKKHFGVSPKGFKFSNTNRSA